MLNFKKCEETFCYDNETHQTICYLSIGDQVYEGKARCHPDDIEFATEYVGCEIARSRAIEKALRQIIKEDVIALKAIGDFYKSVKDSRSLRDNNFWIKTKLLNKIKEYEEDIEEAKKHIAILGGSIKTYTAGKSALYEQIKKLRKGKSADKSN